MSMCLYVCMYVYVCARMYVRMSIYPSVRPICVNGVLFIADNALALRCSRELGNIGHQTAKLVIPPFLLNATVAQLSFDLVSYLYTRIDLYAEPDDGGFDQLLWFQRFFPDFSWKTYQVVLPMDMHNIWVKLYFYVDVIDASVDGQLMAAFDNLRLGEEQRYGRCRQIITSRKNSFNRGENLVVFQMQLLARNGSLSWFIQQEITFGVSRKRINIILLSIQIQYVEESVSEDILKSADES